MAFWKAECASPISPFSFRNHEELSSASSSSMSEAFSETCASSSVSDSSSEDSDEELTPLSLSISDMPPGFCASDNNNQDRLRTAMRKARHLKLAVDRSTFKIQNFTDSMPPLSLKSTIAKGLDGRIDRALDMAVSVLKIFQSAHHLKQLVEAGPRGDVARYLAYVSRLEDAIIFINDNFFRAVQRLNEAVEFLQTSKGADRFRIHKLNETVTIFRKLQAGNEEMSFDGGILEVAFEKLEKEFKSVLVENAAQDGKFRSSVVQNLRLIVDKFIAKGKVHKLLDIYERVRSRNAKKSLMVGGTQYLQHRTVEAIDGLEWTLLEGQIASWIEHMDSLRNLFASEHDLCRQLFHTMDKQMWTECLARVARSVELNSFLIYGEAVARSRKEPQKLFKLLEMYVALDKLRPSLADVFGAEGCMEIKQQARELQKRVVLAACKVFLEFGLQVEAQRGSLPSNGGVLKLTSYVVNYLKYLLTDAYRPVLSQVLKMEQSWRGLNPEEEQLSEAIIDIMEMLERTLEARGKSVRDPAYYYFFLMNNYWYIYTRSKNSELDSVVGETWVKQIKHKADSAALKYQKEAWGSVLSHLLKGRETGSSSSRLSMKEAAVVRQRMRTFEDAFEKMYEKHSEWVIPNPDLCQLVGKAVIQTVVTEYEAYVHKYRSVLQHEELQYSVVSIKSMLSELFEQQIERKSNDSFASRTRVHTAHFFASES